MISENVKEREFILDGFRYCAKQWGDSGTPFIALHGWLDNSASFDMLAPILCDAIDIQILALDLAGHGLSDHRNGFTDYPFWSEIMPLFAIADKMGWEQFNLMGHSRGAMICGLAASVYPDRIKQVVLIDCIAPGPTDVNETIETMQKNIKNKQRRMQRKMSVYPTYESAIEARVKSEITKVNQATAKLLAVRGLSQVDGGYHWHTDDKLWGGSLFSLTAEQIKSYISKISSDVLVLFGKDGFDEMFKDRKDYLQFNKDIIDLLNPNVLYFDDGHYLHMQQAVKDVAKAIVSFISNDK